MEEPLARFFANVFSYDPLYIPKPQNKSDNKKDSYEELEVRTYKFYRQVIEL